MSVLGCGDYQVFIHERATVDAAIFEIPWSSIEWGRVLDETSAATIRAGAGCCGEVLESQVRPWSHQISIHRKAGALPYERAWSGPVSRLADAPEGLVIEARDLSAWHDRRFVHGDQFHIGADLSTIFEAIWDDAMAPDPVPQYGLAIDPAGKDGDREILAEQHRIAGEELRELGRTGLDWTVVDRFLRVRGEEINTPTIASLFDSHFVTPPEVEIQGADQANHWIVSGAGGGAEGDEVFGEATVAPGPEGLLEAVASEPGILDQTSADEAAQTRLDRSASLQSFIREGRLSIEAPVAMSALIPGALVQIGITGRCIPVQATQRLSGIRVTVTREEGAVSESVSIQVEPVGSTA